MLATCWQHAGNMLATCLQHAGNNKAFSQGPETFSQGPEAFMMETGGPFENCSLSSAYSVLLGARLGAIRAQKGYLIKSYRLKF